MYYEYDLENKTSIYALSEYLHPYSFSSSSAVLLCFCKSKTDQVITLSTL